MTKKRKQAIIIALIVAVVAILLLARYFVNREYSGDNLKKYTGKWILAEQWYNGEIIGLNLSDQYFKVNDDGSYVLQQSFSRDKGNLEYKNNAYQFADEDGNVYYLSRKKGYLLFHVALDGNSEDQAIWIYKKS